MPSALAYPLTAATFLRDTRKAQGLTQSQLAALAHTTQSAISRYECGWVDPTIGSLEHLLRAMGFTLKLGAERV